MINTILLVQDGNIENIRIPYNVNLDEFTYTNKFENTGLTNPILLNEWHLFDNIILMYGWDIVNSGYENKHILPPPIDNKLYFYDILLLKLDTNGHLSNLSESEYMNFKTKTMEGFEDIENDSQLSEDFEFHDNIEAPDEIHNSYDNDNLSDNSDDSYDSDDSDEINEYHNKKNIIDKKINNKLHNITPNININTDNKHNTYNSYNSDIKINNENDQNIKKSLDNSDSDECLSEDELIFEIS
jgi:hypothetical protein